MKNKQTITQIKESLTNPQNSFRSAPFWGWNDRIQAEEVDRQIEGMKEEHMGGFFIHSREGLETEYLSEEWMNCVEESIKKAEETGLEAWIYDEDKWPSGSAGGLVSAKNPERYTAKGLTLEIKEEQGQYEEDPSILYRCQRVWNGKEVEMIFRCEISGSSEWYNGYAPSDNLNPEAVKEFLNLTHEKYKERFGEKFGTTIQGFFTDEPNFCDFFSVFTPGRPWLPWTENLEKIFKEQYGYELTERLPDLFLDSDTSAKTRHDYCKLMTLRFQNSYMKQLYDWCDENHLKMTGHVLYENDMGYSARVSGASMPHYKYMHAPGIDILGDQTKEFLTVKQCSSVANQYGREMTITETYGCTGWEFSFEGQKCLADWQFVLGINRRCQHLALYSITGCRKRDYPPVFNYQTTWWKYNKILEDYFARLSTCLRQGEVIRNILLVHPMSTIWTQSKSDPSEDLQHIEMNMGWLDEHIFRLNREGEQYNQLAAALVGMHHDFDFGDEILMEQDGSAADGKLQIAKKGYGVVVVPEVKTLFASTVTLLEEFLKQGGTVIWMGKLPEMVDAESSDRIQKLAEYPNLLPVKDVQELMEALLVMSERPVRITDRKGQECTDILTMTREVEQGRIVFAVNTDRDHSKTVQMMVSCVGNVEEFHLLEEGQQLGREVMVSEEEGKMTWVKEFAPGESIIYMMDYTKAPLLGNIGFPYEHPHRAENVWACLGPEAKQKRTMENVLTLDTCCYQIADGEWSKEMEVWMAQREIREVLSMPQIYYNGAPQRYSWIHKPESGYPQKVSIKVPFFVKELPQDKMFFVIEKPYDMEITCNGTTCQAAEEYFMDRDMKKFYLSNVKEGKNEIMISCLYTQERELEDMFVTGEFAVDCKRRIGKEEDTLHFGDWTSQGYFHYAGSMQYFFQVPAVYQKCESEKIFLKLGEYKGTLAKIEVNGKIAGYLWGKGRRNLEITDFLQEGSENQIMIEVVGSPRNMFGPFHQTYTGCSRISWADFRTEGVFHTDAYVVEPYGLMEQIVLYKA